jgi:hypothetical protein
MEPTSISFSDYSSVLKEVLDINQVYLNNIVVASDLGKSMGWLSGLASLYLPMWTVLLIAGCLGFVGYGVQWLSLVWKISPLAYWQVGENRNSLILRMIPSINCNCT